MLPSYLEEYEAHSNIQKVPSSNKRKLQELYLINLCALLSAPIQFTQPLVDVLKVKPRLWKDLGKCVGKIKNDTQFFIGNLDEINETNTKKNFMPVIINKVGEYCEGKEETPEFE